MDKQKNVVTRPGEAERPHESGAAAPGRGGRMSRQRKTMAVLPRQNGRPSSPIASARLQLHSLT
jgi:hypothetical protein